MILHNAFTQLYRDILHTAVTMFLHKIIPSGIIRGKEGIRTIVVGDHNYGEGSSREHAAMQPRHLGVAAVLVKSFARIHETNLKKQGMLALTFANESDYDLIQEDDTFNFVDISDFAPGKPLTLEVVHSDGSTDTIIANHSYNDAQIKWFKEGSALNLIKKENA